ncbi:MAG: DUF1194 domain-containing protein [Pseudomonadota bacterium]
MAAACCALILTLPPSPSRAQEAEFCALELILALDVSGSVDVDEFALQTGGLADALEDPQVIAAIGALDGGAIITMTHWSGASRQRQMIGWHHVSDEQTVRGLAAAIRGAGRAWRNYSTAIGEALAHAMAIGQDAPMACMRRVIDVSGDGVSNEGRPPRPLSDAAVALGYTVNGLVIRGAAPDPLPQYVDEVIAGPGAFVEVAERFSDYPEAIRRKLLREIDQPLSVSGLLPMRGGGAYTLMAKTTPPGGATGTTPRSEHR